MCPQGPGIQCAYLDAVLAHELVGFRCVRLALGYWPTLLVGLIIHVLVIIRPTPRKDVGERGENACLSVPCLANEKNGKLLPPTPLGTAKLPFLSSPTELLT